MNLLLLAGNSSAHKDWIRQVQTQLKDLFKASHARLYRHWQQHNPIIDLDWELKQTVSKISSWKRGDYCIFAKSAGNFLALKGIYEKKLAPVRCIFVGFPAAWGREHNFDLDLWLSNYSVPTLFIQHDHDPAGSSQSLSQLLKKKELKNYSLKVIPGNTHDYLNFSQLKQLTADFIFS